MGACAVCVWACLTAVSMCSSMATMLQTTDCSRKNEEHSNVHGDHVAFTCWWISVISTSYILWRLSNQREGANTPLAYPFYYLWMCNHKQTAWAYGSSTQIVFRTLQKIFPLSVSSPTLLLLHLFNKHVLKNLIMLFAI